MTVTPTPARSRLDPEPMPRRDFLGLASLWAAASTMVFAAIGMLRLPKAAVLASPSKKFKVNLPDSLPQGEGFVPPGRSVAVFKDKEGVYAVSLICTHLGCIVKQTQTGFDCPCHGSRFAHDGTVMKGPAPAPLKWHKVAVSGSSVTVDEESSVPAGTKVQA